jgi:hypothetical protein
MEISSAPKPDPISNQGKEGNHCPNKASRSEEANAVSETVAISTMLSDRVCPICEQPFTPKRRDSKLCSAACRKQGQNRKRRDATRAKLAEKKCLNCAESFTPKRASNIYCSTECNDKAQKRKKREATESALALVRRICKNRTCSIEFVPTRGNMVFCCVGCSQTQAKRDWKERNKDFYKASENARLKRKYNKDHAFKESKKARSKEHYHSLSPQEKFDRNLQNRKRLEPERRREYFRLYVAERSASDPDFKLINLMRTRTRLAIRSGQGIKQKRTEELLGCSIQEARLHIESLFEIGMTWENWTTDVWHLDHIRPCTSFDLKEEDQQRVCFNWRNLRPIWARENLIKKDLYEPGDELSWIQHMLNYGFTGNLFLMHSTIVGPA